MDYEGRDIEERIALIASVETPSVITVIRIG